MSPCGRLRRRAAAFAAAALLAGCSLLAGPPPHLYRLTPKTTFPPDLPHSSVQLLVDTPLASGGLDTRRIALSRAPVSIDYFADSDWTDPVSAIVQVALLESFESSRAITALDRDSAALRADFVLKTEIRHFEAVYAGSSDSPPEVWVSLEARVVAMPRGIIIAQALFERRERAAANDVPQIVTAFDEALGGVIKRLVVWTVSNPALSAPRR
jgi:cholesterol transport system auxiliary component